ncbi:hypothetical protein SG34_020235 [Thalassomonas viridans]|uniref:Uncharacterized protein n=1 Tax=Thalassomonas viridans TaxID=137584 RepID=A0AAE9Z1V0_9GAMM|nr:hypothetical protein [Thalassomonas viridans]WDE03692.1 hypothetical protein SG34_020235 [Thalassomonas viridans]
MNSTLFELSGESWLFLFGGISFLFCAAATFCFGRISVKHIEQEMAKEGKLPPEWDKGIGARITMYAIVIVTRKIVDNTLINDELVLRYARKKDWYLAVFFLGSFAVLISIVVVTYLLYSTES